MDIRSNDDVEPIDHKTSRSICDAIGERLQDHSVRNMRSLASPAPVAGRIAPAG